MKLAELCSDLQSELVFEIFSKHASLLRTRAPSAPYSSARLSLCCANFPGFFRFLRVGACACCAGFCAAHLVGGHCDRIVVVVIDR